jgi:hypothetical protein
MGKQKSFDRKRSRADRDARRDPTPGGAWPRLDSIAHGPLSDVIERFRTRLIEEAGRIAGTQTVDANHLEQAYERLLASPTPADWAVLNRRRVYLIQKELTGRISAAEATELEALQAQADRHMAETAPRPLEALWDLERKLHGQ